ncbi:hypothetical protein Sjap_011676 [Stephania japonica]|uniref:Pentatricopeptide repeat-containing protein n=1 Tax=Stephania japonica TaxID=461633 RepID=A0AAP0JBU4_9MAGN
MSAWICSVECLYANVDPNSVTFAGVLSACGELAVLDRGIEIHGHSIRACLDNNILVGNGLINMYVKCGKLKEAQIIFDKLGDRDLVSWNSMIAGYGMHGFGEDGLLTFRQMVEVGQRPDEVTFVAVLSACSHAGLVTEGRQLFDQIVNVFSIQPLMEHYACMVDLLGRAGMLQEACDIIKNMPMEPNVCVWGALLNSCRMYKNTDLAEVAAAKIFSLETRTAGSYMLLSNLYSACGSWKNSAKVRMLAKTKGLKKNPGQSWIEVQNKVHTFLAGNALQPGLKEVYHILEDLGLKMETDYVTDSNSELQEGLYDEDRLLVRSDLLNFFVSTLDLDILCLREGAAINGDERARFEALGVRSDLSSFFRCHLHGEVLVDHLRRRRMRATTLSAQLSLLKIVGAENPVLISAAEQIFGAGGKKLRPALVFLVSRATADLANLKVLDKAATLTERND